MKSSWMRRVARTVVGLAVGALVGGAIGLAGYRLVGSEEDLFEDLAATFEGGLVGATAVGALGFWWPEWRAARSGRRVFALLAWLLSGLLLITGIVYIGGWTDADGPSTEAMIGILGIPASVFLIWRISKHLEPR